MNKTYLALLLALVSFSSYSGVFSSDDSVLSKLKNTPATKYELGRHNLEMYTFLITNKMRGEWKGESINRFKR